MSASAFAAISAFEMISFGENLVTFGRQIVIDAFSELILLKFVHKAKILTSCG